MRKKGQRKSFRTTNDPTNFRLIEGIGSRGRKRFYKKQNDEDDWL